MNVLYNPTVGANVMSKSFAASCLGENPCSPTTRTLQVAPRTVLKGLGILHHITLHPKDVDLVLGFHIFDIQDFDILIGHPLEKLYANPLRIGEMNVKLGRDTYPIQVTRAKNSVAEPLLTRDSPMEVMSVGSFESPKSSLEKDEDFFKKTTPRRPLTFPKRKYQHDLQLSLNPYPPGYAMLS